MVDFAAINARADANRASHTQRMADKARAHFDAHPDRAIGIDPEARCWPGWWLNASFWDGIDSDWQYAGRHRPYEVLALRNIRDQAGRVVEMVPERHEDVLPAAYLSDALNAIRDVYLRYLTLRAEYLTLRELHHERGFIGDFIPAGDIERDPRQQRYTFVLVEQAA